MNFYPLPQNDFWRRPRFGWFEIWNIWNRNFFMAVNKIIFQENDVSLVFSSPGSLPTPGLSDPTLV